MTEELQALIVSTIEDAEPDLEVVEVRVGTSRGKTHVLVKVDHVEGIDVEKLSQINRHLGDLLDQSPSLRGSYVLEVSSAGVERPLTTPEHYQRFTGRKAKLVLWNAHEGNAVVSGLISGYVDGKVIIQTPQEELSVSLEEIKRANLVFEM